MGGSDRGPGGERGSVLPLAEPDSGRLIAAGRRRRFERNEVLFHEGDGGDSVHLITRGRVAVRITTPLGDVATLDVLGPGETIGELALLGAERRAATAVALEGTETVSVERTSFDELRRRHPSLDEFLLRLLAARVRRTSARVAEALYVPADLRVLRRLLSLAEVFGSRDGKAVVPLTQEDLAGLAGTTRPTVNRVLRAEERRGTLSLGRGRITILDPETIAKRAG